MEIHPHLSSYYLKRLKASQNPGLMRFRFWRPRRVRQNDLNCEKCLFCGQNGRNSQKLSWRENLNLASVAGFQMVSQATSAQWICLWTLLLSIGIACTARDVYTVTLQFLEYPALTSVTLDQAAALQFPAVTVCSLNRVHCGNLRRLAANSWGTDLGSRLLKLHDLTDCQLQFRKRRQTAINGQDESLDPLLTTQVPITGSTEKPNSTNQTQTFNDLMHFMAIYANFSSDIRDEIGHSYSEFIRSCTFSGESCHNDSMFFHQHSTIGYGNCFTFQTTRKTVIPGKDYGLSMEIFLDQANYLRAGLSPQAGARVVVHEKDHQPLPEESGINISPNTATSIALLEVKIIRQQTPYQSNCTFGWENSGYEKFVNSTFTYSAQRCQRVCLQVAFEDSCQCSHPAYMDLVRGFPPCNLTSGTLESECATKVLNAFEGRVLTCSCNMDCREVTYDTTISTAAWPTDTDWCRTAKRLLLVDSCEGEDQEFGGKTRKQERLRIQSDLLKVNVYLQSLRVRSVSQTPAMPPQVFVASLGGALSLYLGLSLLSLIEIAGLFLRLMGIIAINLIAYCSRVKWSSRQRNLRLPWPVLVTGRFTPPPQRVPRAKFVW